MTTEPFDAVSPPADFGPDSAGARLAERIAREVLSARSPPGTLIASQQDLRASHGAGRAVFRQAVRILEERGVAYMRRGPGGGLVVAEPNPDFVGRSLSILVESLTRDIQQLGVLPYALETHLFLHGAPRLGPEACERIRGLIHRLDRMAEAQFQAVGGHRLLHQAIRTASREPAVLLANRTASEFASDIMPYSINVSVESERGEAWRITREAAEALIAGDTPTLFDCRRRMLAMFHARWPTWNETDHDPGSPPKTVDPGRPEFNRAGNQAERLTREILREIRSKGWRAGERIGSGAELMARYGASTTILRQAVRMLEEHSAVEFIRGRKGGLYVATPNRARTIAQAAAFLARSAPAPADIHAFLTQLILEGLNQARAARLAGGRKQPQARETIAFGDFCTFAATQCANPMVELFVEILLPFGVQQSQAATQPGAVLDAFTAGDLATRRRLFLTAAWKAGGSEAR